jgi:hypothetical protein
MWGLAMAKHYHVTTVNFGCPGGYPNKIGHELVHDYLIFHIDHVIINE